jgi:hypothetical protein
LRRSKKRERKMANECDNMLLAIFSLGAAFGISLITAIELAYIMVKTKEVSNRVINELVTHLIVIVVALSLLFN